MRRNGGGRSVIEVLEGRRMLSAVPVPIADLAVDEALDASPIASGATSVYAGGTVYFADVTSRTRDTAQLWKTDPVTGQTTFIQSFSGPYNPTTPVISNMVAGAGSTAYFIVNPSSGNPQIWRTDGTAAGTRQITPYPGSGSFYLPLAGGRTAFVRRGGSTYFAAGGVWRVDDASPYVAYPVTNGGTGGGLTLANGTLYFISNQGTASGLYQINDAGTTATRIFSAVDFPVRLMQNEGVLYFFGVDPASSGGYQLYKSDGTAAGTQVVAPAPINSTTPGPLIGAGDNVYFTASTAAAGYELWKSDGTAAGTGMVVDLNPGGGYALVDNPVAYHDELYFTAYTGSGTGRALWKTDGTAGGTVCVAPLDGAAASAVLEAAVVGDGLYFAARTAALGNELWRLGADGTAQPVSDRYPGRGSSRPHELVDANGTLYYQGIDPVLGYGLFRSDGTGAGTSLVKDYLAGPLDARYFGAWVIPTADGRVFYADGDGTNTGRELYVTDGTAGGTGLVKDVNPGSLSSTPDWLTDVNGTLYFTAQASSSLGVELWKSDGTAAGTVLVKDVRANDYRYSDQGSHPTGLTKVGGTLYFAADDGVNGNELWRSDGTAAGTVMFDLATGAASSYPQSMTDVNGTLFFMASGSTGGTYNLYKLAPGDAGPVFLKAFKLTYPNGGVPYRALTNVNGVLYFAGDDGTHGTELWRSDGTANGTVMVKDIKTTGNLASQPDGLVVLGKTLIFYADDGVTGRELWKSDGTAAGTVLLKDIYPNKYSESLYNGSNPYPYVVNNGFVYFYATDVDHGQELWRTDGTAAGTVLVKDIRPGATSSSPSWFGVVGGRLYFAADDGVSGTELWTTDGTDAGTIRVSDLNPGPASSGPFRIVGVNGAVVFLGSDGVHGPTLYRFEPESVKPTVVTTQFTRVGGGPAVVVDFDEDVSGSLAGADLVVTNLTTGQTLDPATFTVTYDAGVNRATFTLGGGVLADGNYRVTLAANGVRDTSGNPLAADGTLDFFVLAGDANGDRTVNFADLLALAKNYGRSGVGLAEGDFDGDGVVNFADLLMLAKNYNRVLEVPLPAAPVMTAAVVSTASKRQMSSPSPAKPLFSTRPVAARPAPPVKGKSAASVKRRA